MKENLKYYHTDEDEGRELIHPNGKTISYCGEPEDNTFFRDHSRVIDELNLLLNALNKFGSHSLSCGESKKNDRPCDCGWDKFEEKLLIEETK